MSEKILQEKERKRIATEQRNAYILGKFKELRDKYPMQTPTAVCTLISTDVGLTLQGVRDIVKRNNLWDYGK